MKELSFKKIFTLYKAETPIHKIAKETGVSAYYVSKIISGIWPIPLSQIKEMREAGFKICSCCKRRTVPLKPINNVQLTRLCWYCFKKEDSELVYEQSLLNYLTNLD